MTAWCHRDVAVAAETDALLVLVDFDRELGRDRDVAAGDLVTGNRPLAGLDADGSSHGAVLAFEHERVPTGGNVVERQWREARLLAIEYHARAVRR